MKGYSRIDLDSVAPLMPADRVAGRVVSKGDHFEYTPPTHHLHQATPIKVRLPTICELMQPTFKDLKGTTIGRLTVMGIAVVPGRDGQNWSVRCVCGAFETRKAKYIKVCASGDNPGGQEPMCVACAYTRRLQRGRGSPKKSAAAAKVITDAAR